MSFVRPVAILVALTTVVAAQPSPVLTKEFQDGVDAFRLGKFDEAREHLLKAKALDPKLPGPNRFLAAVAQAQGKWQECIDAARVAIELNPRSGEIGDTRKVHDECRMSAGRAPYREELGDSAAIAVQGTPGATVKVGGLNYGGTPLAPRPITAGPIEVDIEKQGWKPVHVSINALPGVVTDVIVELEPDPNAQTNVDLGVKPSALTTGKLVIGADIPVITVDGQSFKTVDGMVELPPGTHVIVIDKEGHDAWRRRVRISGGQKTKVVPVFVATEAREKKEKLGVVLVGTGAAIGIFGFVAMLKSEHAAKDAREINRLETSRPPAGMFTRQDFLDARDESKKWSLISTVSFGAAITSIGVGAVFLYLGGRERSDVPPPFAVSPVSGGAVVSRGVSW